MSQKVQETFAKIFIERVEERRAAGDTVAPWRKMWNPALGMDRNLDSGAVYRGSNVFMTAIQGFESPFWVTFKQAEKLGGSIKRDENGKTPPYTPILFWKWPTPEEKEAGRMPFCRFSRLYNVEQTDGLEEKAARKLDEFEGPTLEPIAAAQAIVDGWHGCPPIAEGGGRACYNPEGDRISMPTLAAFSSGGGAAEDFYHTLFHEMGHATGHRTRLNRDGVANPVRFQSHDYSEEELVAEMSAGMLAGFAGINTEAIKANSAAYLDHWLKVLRRDPLWLGKAGGQAQKAVDLIRGIKWEKAEKADK